MMTGRIFGRILNSSKLSTFTVYPLSPCMHNFAKQILMERSSLLELLKTFSANDYKEFVAFVNSPYFNREKILERFARILFESHPHFTKSNEDLFSELYPGKKYNDNLMRNIRSDLLRLAEQFLSVKEFLSSRSEVKLKLVDQLSRRNLSKHCMKQITSLNELLESGEFKDDKYFLCKFQLEREYDSLLARSGEKYLRETRRDKIIENLVSHFFINFIHFSSAELNRKKIISDSSAEASLPFQIDSILEGEGMYLLKDPYIKLFYHIYKVLKDEDEKHFRALKKIITDGMIGISDKDKPSVLSAASNFAYLKALAGEERFLNDQFELSMLSVTSGYHKKQKGHLPLIIFLNAVIIGLELKEANEIERFIEDYGKDLLEDYRETAQHFCKALINYKKKDYDKAVTELSKVNAEEFSFKQQIKSLYLKIYFDLNEAEAFYFHSDSYRHFISENKKIHKLVRKQLSDYLMYTKKLFALKNSTEEIDNSLLRKLTDEIKSNPSLINRRWLLEKADEIRSGKS